MKQIKNITLALAATLLLLAAGCTADADAVGDGTIIPPGTPIEVDITLGGVSQMTPAGTRAANTTLLEKDRTVRIIPFNKRTGKEETQATYYVTDNAGTLAPCSVNTNGKFIAATTEKLKLKLNDPYNLLVISSASSSDRMLHHRENEDYSAISQELNVTDKNITLPPLIRHCSQLKIVVKKLDSDNLITGISISNNFQLAGLPTSATIGRDNSLALSGYFTGSTLIETKHIIQTNPTTVSTVPLSVLPGAQTLNTAFPLKLTFQPPGAASPVTKTVTYGLKVPLTEAMKPGYSYLLTLTVNSENATVIPSVQITDWDMTGGDLTPPADYEGQPPLTMRYPYVSTNAEGKNRVIVTKDVFGEVFGITHGDFTIHAPWLQTPAHKLLNSVGGISAEAYQVSAKFEIAENDVSDTPAPWGSTNGPCVAPWRRFTVGEYQMLTNAIKKKPLDITPFKQDPLYSYWLCEDENETEAYTLEFRTQPKSTPAYTRCVRDYGVISADYAHVVGSSIISKDEYGTTGGTFHPNWGSNDVPLHFMNDAQYNTVSARFEVGSYSEGRYPGEDTKAYCAAYSQASGAAGTWRVPTLAELTLMYALKAQLPDDGGWIYECMSSTRWSDASGHPDQIESYWGYGDDGYTLLLMGVVRCVRDY